MNILLLLGGVGVFIAGMKEMSKGLSQSANKGVRSLFKKISGNRFAGYGVGIGSTALLQSSSTTSIMTIGLASADIIDHRQGASIMLGAKVGTTLTAFIFATSGLSRGSFNIGALFSVMAFVGIIISMLTQKENVKKFAMFLAGFGMIFFGLEVMGNIAGGTDSVLRETIEGVFKYKIMMNPALLVIIGVVFTCIIQSSTAAMGVFIVLVSRGVITIDQSFFLIMGANIGTCLDGVMAAIGSNANGKRIALFHVMTSTIGAIFFTVLLVIFRIPVTNLFSRLFVKPEWSLAFYNLIYNVLYTLVLLLLLTPLVKLTEKVFKEKKLERKKVLKYLDERMLQTPAIVLSQVKREVIGMARLAEENLLLSFGALISGDKSVLEKVKSNETSLNTLNQEIAAFLIQYSAVTQNVEDEFAVGATHHIINDIERIGDHADNFMEIAELIAASGETFSDDSLIELNAMFDKVKSILELGLATYESGSYARLEEIAVLENEIDEMNSLYAARHITRLSTVISNVEVQYYYDVISELERISDHVVNIAFSIVSPIGRQSAKKAAQKKTKKMFTP